MPATKKMLGFVKRGEVAENPDADLLPAEFVKGVSDWKKLVKKAGGHDKVSEKSALEMAQFLSGFLAANFVPDNIDGIDEILHKPEEIDAKEIRVVAFAFDDDELIPGVSVEAIFELSFKKDMTAEALKKWEDKKGDPLAWCLNFYWNFDDVDSDDWEGYLDTNDGVEMVFI